MPHLASRALPALSLLALVACSATDGSNEFPSGSGAGGPTGGTGSGGSTGVGIMTGSGGSTGAGNPNGCIEAATLVYVLSAENDLYSFRPDAREFTLIGQLGCGTAMQPNSMAIDRDATAWVNFVENDGFGDTAGVVYRVSTADASCEPTPAANLPQQWYRMGMGFSSDVAGGAAETLYVTGTGDPIFGGGPGLGRIDTGSGGLTPIGQFTQGLDGQNAELTGTGDGRLYGFFTTSPVVVAELNKSSGAVVTPVDLPTVETPSYWAFSFWGGDFYLYTAPSDPARTTNVTRYRPSDGSVDTSYMTNIGFRIVGAGVSTCAPLTPPE